MNQTVDILCRARELYASAPSHAAMPSRPEDGTYCAVTAVLRASKYQVHAFAAASDAIVAVIGTPNIARWNAKHSTRKVLAAFDRAITAEGLRVPPLQRTERTVPVLAGQES